MCLGEWKSDIPWLYTMHIALSQEAGAFYRNAEKSREVCVPPEGFREKRAFLGFADRT